MNKEISELNDKIEKLMRTNNELKNHLGHIYMELYALQRCVHNSQYCKVCKDNYEKYLATK